MIDVPDEKTITGLTRSELITLVYGLKKERDDLTQKAREKLLHELKEIRVRVETVSARLHALINDLPPP